MLCTFIKTFDISLLDFQKISDFKYISEKILAGIMFTHHSSFHHPASLGVMCQHASTMMLLEDGSPIASDRRLFSKGFDS